MVTDIPSYDEGPWRINNEHAWALVVGRLRRWLTILFHCRRTRGTLSSRPSPSGVGAAQLKDPPAPRAGSGGSFVRARARWSGGGAGHRVTARSGVRATVRRLSIGPRKTVLPVRSDRSVNVDRIFGRTRPDCRGEPGSRYLSRPRVGNHRSCICIFADVVFDGVVEALVTHRERQ